MKPQRRVVWLTLAFKSGEKKEEGCECVCVPESAPSASAIITFVTSGWKKNCSYDSTVISEGILDIGPATPPSLVPLLNPESIWFYPRLSKSAPFPF